MAAPHDVDHLIETALVRPTGGKINLNLPSLFALAIAFVGSIPLVGEEFAVTRGQQLRTAADICTIATSLSNYKMDNRKYPAGEGEICVVEASISPLYVKFMPRYDAWGTTLRYVASSDGQHFRIESAAADKTFEEPRIAFGSVVGVYSSDPAADIVLQDDQFVQAPPEIMTSRPTCKRR